MIPTVLLQSIGTGGVSTGSAIIAVGILALLFWALIRFRNPAGVIMWCIAVISLLMAVLFDLRDEIFFLAILGTVALVTVGVSARMLKGR